MKKTSISKAVVQILEGTTWARGIYTERFAVPGARPAQIRAGARKIIDQMRAQGRRKKRDEKRKREQHEALLAEV